MSDDELEDDLIATILAGAGGLLWFASLLCGAWVFLHQVGGFLSEGTWHSVSLIDAIEWLEWGSLSDWGRHPGSWLGVHKILDFLPAALGIPLIGGVFIIPAYLYAESNP